MHWIRRNQTRERYLPRSSRRRNLQKISRQWNRLLWLARLASPHWICRRQIRVFSFKPRLLTELCCHKRRGGSCKINLFLEVVSIKSHRWAGMPCWSTSIELLWRKAYIYIYRTIRLIKRTDACVYTVLEPKEYGYGEINSVSNPEAETSFPKKDCVNMVWSRQRRSSL